MIHRCPGWWFHRWGAWGERAPIKQVDQYGRETSGVIAWSQARTCARCGIIEHRKVRV